MGQSLEIKITMIPNDDYYLDYNYRLNKTEALLVESNLESKSLPVVGDCLIPEQYDQNNVILDEDLLDNDFRFTLKVIERYWKQKSSVTNCLKLICEVLPSSWDKQKI